MALVSMLLANDAFLMVLNRRNVCIFYASVWYWTISFQLIFYFYDDPRNHGCKLNETLCLQENKHAL